VAIAVVAGLVYWRTRSGPPAEPETAAPEPRPAAGETKPAPQPVEPIELPSLDASDELVARLVAGLSSNPRLAAMLAGEDLVRRFVTAIVNISEGESARSQIEVLEPSDPFTVRRVGGDLVPSMRSYSRYDAVANVVSSLDTAGTVRLYRQLEPLIDEAFADLGFPGRDFDEMLVAALDHLIATPVAGDDLELVADVDVYSYADPKLEALSPAQKQLLRTGSENMGKIQAKLRELRRELDAGG
jgi:hypothetical protein